MVVDGARARMRGDDRRGGERRRVHHGGLGRVRHVDHDAGAIEGRDELLPEGREPAVPGRRVAEVGARVGAVAELVVAEVGDPDVAHAALGPHGHVGDALAQGIGVLHADERDALARRDGVAHLLGAGRERDLVGIGRRHALDGAVLELHDLARPGVAFLGQRLLLRVEDEEGRVQAACAHLGQVDLARREASGIRRGGGEVERDVDMGVECEEARVD